MKQLRFLTIIAALVLLAALLGSAALANTTAVSTAAGPADTFNLTLLHTNDFHARVDGQSGIGGSARLATTINEFRATNNNVMLVDAGDQFQGTLFYRLFKADIITQTMNLLGYDAMTIGNHEFDDGPAQLARLINGVNFPVISANIDASAEPALAGLIMPTAIITVNGEQIGVVGVTTSETDILSSPGPNVHFTNEVAAVQAAVDQFTTQGINKVIALTHIGYYEDIALAQAVHGLDVIVGGHSHTFIYTPETAPVNSDIPVGPYPTVANGTDGNPILVVTAFQWSRYLGHLDVTFDETGVATAWGGNPIFMGANVAQDPTVQALVDSYRAEVDVLRNTFIGETTVELPIIVGGQQICRAGECLMGNLVTDAMLRRVNMIDPNMHYDFAITNGGGLRAPIDVGPISIGEVFEVLPFGNTIATFGLRGSDVVAALENGVSRVGSSGNGRFPQVSGIRFKFNLKFPVGSRVSEVEVWDGTSYQPIEPDRVYNVASNNFMRLGGDGYSIFRDNAINPYDFGPGLEDAVMDYVTVMSPITPMIEGRITQVTVTDAIQVVPTTAMVGETATVSVSTSNTGGVNGIMHIVPFDANQVEYVEGSATNGAFPVRVPLNVAMNLLKNGGAAALKAAAPETSGVVAVAWVGNQAPDQTVAFDFQLKVLMGAAGAGVNLTVKSYVLNTEVSSATTTLSVPALNAYEMTFQDGTNGYSGTDDTYLNAWMSTTTYGAGSNFYIRQPGIKTALVKFDLSSVTAMAQVSQAQIGLYVTYGSGNAVTMEAYEVTRVWAEDSASWMDAAAGAPWEMPGAMGPSDHAASFSDRVSFGGGGRWVWFDVTSSAQMWVGDPGSNNGIVIMGSGATNSELEFTASEYVVTFVRPQLKLIYQAP